MRTDARKSALKIGEKRYFSGSQCKYGNVAERITSCGRCLCKDCILDHANKVKARHQKITGCFPRGESPRQVAKSAGAKRYQDGKTCNNGNVSPKLTSNTACLCTECERDRREKNPAMRAAVIRNWRIRNPDSVREYKSSRRQAMCRVSWGDKGSIDAVYAKARELEAMDGVKRHVDHDIPLRGKLVSGLHVHQNLRILTATDNMRKGTAFHD